MTMYFKQKKEGDKMSYEINEQRREKLSFTNQKIKKYEKREEIKESKESVRK